MAKKCRAPHPGDPRLVCERRSHSPRTRHKAIVRAKPDGSPPTWWGSWVVTWKDR